MATAPGPNTPSTWNRWGPAFVVLALVCLLAGGYLIDHAAPQTRTLLDERWDKRVRTDWDVALVRIGAALLAACAGTAAIGLLTRLLIGGPGSGHDAKAKALMAFGAIGIVALAWITWRGPLG